MKTKEVKVIRNYKDTVFRMLYREKKALLELYNALNDTDYQNEDALEIYTLENVIYMNVKNDVSFLVGAELNLYEQQSTYNPNMPLRNLIYIARQLEAYIRQETMYSSKQVKIPAPRFVVFYNGTTAQPERRILCLSEAYEIRTGEPELELKVLMLNLNTGHNKELLERCKTLREYCLFVERVRKYVEKEPIHEAVERAVSECIREGILVDFLQKQRAEVIAMSIFEYNEEAELKKIRADEYELGKLEGERAGKAEGERIGKISGIIEILSVWGEIPAGILHAIEQERDPERLTELLKAAARASSIKEFREMMDSGMK